LDAVGSRTIAVEHGSLRSYPGGWAEYMRAREASAAPPGGARGVAGAASGQDPAKAPVRQRRRSPGGRRARGAADGAAAGPPKDRLREQQRAELAVEESEAALRALEDELAD